MNKQKHVPVLAREVLELLKPKPGESYLDLTAGYGGHASLVLEHLGAKGSASLIDRDSEAIDHLKHLFGSDKRVEIIHNDFLSASQELLSEGRQYGMILADLGVSSPHLDNSDRGFSFSKEGPLDMRMDRTQPLTAAEVVNTYEEEKLARVLRDYGEVRNSRKLARKIIENRPYHTTLELAKKIVQFSSGRRKIHPATEVFQAIRIEVNQELELLEKSLKIWVDLLKPKGRIGVISFHSLEDRLVKQVFRDYGGNGYDARLHIATKKVVVAAEDETVFNPRSRSAKLRVAQRK